MVPYQWKKLVIASAGRKWREFRCKLTTWYIMSFLDSPKNFELPPDDYRMIKVPEWQEFVKVRLSPKFQVCKLYILDLICNELNVLSSYYNYCTCVVFNVFSFVGIPRKTDSKEEGE